MTTVNDSKTYFKVAKYSKTVLCNFYGTRLSSKLPVQDGLSLGALIIEDWLYQYLNDDTVSCLKHRLKGSGKAYRQQMPPSRHICSGYLIDTVSDIDSGIWALRLVTTAPGKVNGRQGPENVLITFEENIGLTVSAGNIHVGISIAVYAPEGVGVCDAGFQTPLYALAAHPLFGLKCGMPVTDNLGVIDTPDKLRKLIASCKDESNRLPTVLFTYCRSVYTNMLPIPTTAREVMLFTKDPLRRPICLDTSLHPRQYGRQSNKPAYDMKKYAESLFGHAKVYLVEDNLFEVLAQSVGVPIKAGDIVVLPCVGSDEGVKTYGYLESEYGRDKTLNTVFSDCIDSQKKVTIPETVAFFADAERLAEMRIQAEMKHAQETQYTFEQMQKQAAGYEQQIESLSSENEQAKNQVANLKEYSSRLEAEKRELLQKLETQEEALRNKQRTDDEEINYLRRALDRPPDHADIPAWVEKYFVDRLVIIPKAAAMLGENSAREISLPLICDALDFLATDYWENRFNRLPWEEVLSSCSTKYKRPFDVGRISDLSISFTPQQYTVTYPRGGSNAPVECKLDQHLKVGNGSELLRIYFFLDEESRKIVVGSLPGHLRALYVN